MANWDESKHPRDDDGKFGSGDIVTPASELQKKSTDELVKINPWDDEKTRKMKMRLAKMHQGNQAIKDDITKRRAHIEEMKRDIAKVAATLPAACTAHEDGGAGAARWFQTFPPYGRYPVGGTIKGARDGAVFVFDEAAAKAILDDFRAKAKRPDWPGLLVDREHFSNDPEKTSDAMAWARDIRQDADGSIWTRWEFTPEGEKLWNGKVLVSRSPLFLSVPAKGRREYRPVALESIGMTNTPHFRELSTLAAAREAAEVTTHEGEIQMEEILKALGLAEDASPEDAVAAVEALKQKASAAESAAAEAEKERDDAVADRGRVPQGAGRRVHRRQPRPHRRRGEVPRDLRQGPRARHGDARRVQGAREGAGPEGAGRRHRQDARARGRGDARRGPPDEGQRVHVRASGRSVPRGVERLPRGRPRTVQRLRKEK